LAVISTGRLHGSIYYHKRPSNTRQINNQASYLILLRKS
jgi:hypothetical protein